MVKKQRSQKEVNDIVVKYVRLKNKAEKSLAFKDVRDFKKFQEFFIKTFTYLVDRNTYRYKRFSNYLDLQQVGFIALLASTKTFKTDRGSFTWWAERYIQTNVSRAANAHSTIRYPIKKAKEIKPYKASCIPIMVDSSPTPFESVEGLENQERIREAIKNLSPEHQLVINLTFGTSGARAKNKSHIIKDMDISRQQYQKLLREAQEQIKKHLDRYV